MNDPNTQHDQTPACILAGALAHLAQHLESGCQRSAYLAAMLLEQVALDPRADGHLRQHAQQLAEILEREPAPFPALFSVPSRAPQTGTRTRVAVCQSLASRGL